MVFLRDAGMTEYLSHRFKLTVPEWIEKPEYFLPEPWEKSMTIPGSPSLGKEHRL
jgi:hypothetical protein